MKKGLVRFSISIAVVLSIVLVFDYCGGMALEKMMAHVNKNSDIGRTYFALNGVSDSIVVVGSSRASHHYVSKTMEDSLGYSVYNIAHDGCFFSYNSCIINNILDRFRPKVIVWENYTGFLSKANDDVVALYPYYDNSWIKNTIMEEVPWTEYVRLKSYLYRYNSIVHKVLIYYFLQNFSVPNTIKGYVPLAPKSLNQALSLKTEFFTDSIFNKSRFDRLEAIFKRAKQLDVKIILVDSPIYQRILNQENQIIKLVKDLCVTYGVVYLDNRQIPYFLEHPELFNDEFHLNELGADIYTDYFLKQISSEIDIIQN